MQDYKEQLRSMKHMIESYERLYLELQEYIKDYVPEPRTNLKEKVKFSLVDKKKDYFHEIQEIFYSNKSATEYLLSVVKDHFMRLLQEKRNQEDYDSL